MEFEHYLQDWCKSKSITWEYDPVNNMHVFTEQPLDPVEHSLEVCFGDYQPISARVSMQVMKAVQSLEVEVAVDTITKTITHTLSRARRIRYSAFPF